MAKERKLAEADWLSRENPKQLLEFLDGRVSERKLRLFACACCRRIWHLIADERSRRAVEICERYADGLADQKELKEARKLAEAPLAGPAPKHKQWMWPPREAVRHGRPVVRAQQTGVWAARVVGNAARKKKPSLSA